MAARRRADPGDSGGGAAADAADLLAVAAEYRTALLGALRHIDNLTVQAEAALDGAEARELTARALAGGASGKKAVEQPETNEPVVAVGHARPARRLITPLRRPIGAPYFADFTGDVPPESEEARERRALYAGLPDDDNRKWGTRENAALRAAVTKAFRDVLRQRAESEYLAGGGASGATAVARRATRDAKIAAAEGYSLDELRVEVDEAELSWRAIAAKVSRRSPGACRVQWAVLSAPKAGEWTRGEERRLLALAQKHRGFAWRAVAAELGTGRSALDCFRRYQRALNPSMLRVAWTAGEDATLREAVRAFGNPEHWWQHVADRLPGRSARQCRLRWEQTVDPSIVSGYFSPEEDRRLFLAVRACGDAWTEVARFVPGRTPAMCRERWVNVVAPSVRREEWSEAEDAALLGAVRRLGEGSWAAVAEELGGHRTDNQCWRRWKSLRPGGWRKAERRQQQALRNGVVADPSGRAIARTTLTEGDVALREVGVADGVTLRVATIADGAPPAVPPVPTPPGTAMAPPTAPGVPASPAPAYGGAAAAAAANAAASAAAGVASPALYQPSLPAPSPTVAGDAQAAARAAFEASLRAGLAEASSEDDGESSDGGSSDMGDA
mmetsp:Transcript_13137/g.45959  ORF Transcript_13137/g.45959 Transcript_13137/m.45959 type:complete len:615 (-) Transcript_13137:162-2006(-)